MQLENRTAFLEWYLHDHGWDTFITQLSMQLIVDNTNPNIAVVDRFLNSGAEVGLVSLDSHRLVDGVIASKDASKRLVLVKSNLSVFSRLNTLAENAGLITVAARHLDVGTLSQAFIRALAK